MTHPGCQAAVPVARHGVLVWEECGAPAVAVHQYACVHEHLQERRTCEEHAPRPGQVGCRACFNAGHECEMTARPIQ